MQREVDAESPDLGLRIVVVNAAGRESGNSIASEGRTLPLLQDTEAVGAWTLWQVEWRDVVMLDSEGRRGETVNLTEHNLAEEANYRSLKEQLLGLE